MPSANNTIISLPGQVIVDAAGNTWSIAAGRVVINGRIDTSTAGVIEMAYENGLVWQKNTSNLWWSKSSPTAPWSPPLGTSVDPIPGQTASANDAILVAKPTGTIVDAGGNRWTIANGQVLINGAADPTTARVIALVYTNGQVWQENADHVWWAKASPSAPWTPPNGTTTAPVFDPSVTANVVMLSSNDDPIMDASGNQWWILNGQVTLNGVADPTTRNVLELAYVGGKIWQENQDHLWWSKAKPSDPWSPAAGAPQNPVAGVFRTWLGQNAAFSTGADWSPSGVPQAGDTAFIQSGVVTVDAGYGTGVNFTLGGGGVRFAPTALGQGYRGQYNIGTLRGTGSVVIGYPPNTATVSTTGILQVGNLLVSEFATTPGGAPRFVVNGDTDLVKGALLTVNEVGTASLPLGTIENNGHIDMRLNARMYVGQLDGQGSVRVSDSDLYVQLGAAASETVQLTGEGHLYIGGYAEDSYTAGLHFLAPISLDDSSSVVFEYKATAEVFKQTAANASELMLYNGSTLVADLKFSGQSHVYASDDPSAGARGAVIITTKDSGHSLPVLGLTS